METHEPNVYFTISGGVSQFFWCPFLDLSARSPIFCPLKKGIIFWNIVNIIINCKFVMLSTTLSWWDKRLWCFFWMQFALKFAHIFIICKHHHAIIFHHIWHIIITISANISYFTIYQHLQLNFQIFLIFCINFAFLFFWIFFYSAFFEVCIWCLQVNFQIFFLFLFFIFLSFSFLCSLHLMFAGELSNMRHSSEFGHNPIIISGDKTDTNIHKNHNLIYFTKRSK